MEEEELTWNDFKEECSKMTVKAINKELKRLSVNKGKARLKKDLIKCLAEAKAKAANEARRASRDTQKAGEDKMDIIVTKPQCDPRPIEEESKPNVEPAIIASAAADGKDVKEELAAEKEEEIAAPAKAQSAVEATAPVETSSPLPDTVDPVEQSPEPEAAKEVPEPKETKEAPKPEPKEEVAAESSNVLPSTAHSDDDMEIDESPQQEDVAPSIVSPEEKESSSAPTLTPPSALAGAPQAEEPAKQAVVPAGIDAVDSAKKEKVVDENKNARSAEKVSGHRINGKTPSSAESLCSKDSKSPLEEQHREDVRKMALQYRAEAKKRIMERAKQQAADKVRTPLPTSSIKKTASKAPSMRSFAELMQAPVSVSKAQQVHSGKTNSAGAIVEKSEKEKKKERERMQRKAKMEARLAEARRLEQMKKQAKAGKPAVPPRPAETSSHHSSRTLKSSSSVVRKAVPSAAAVAAEPVKSRHEIARQEKLAETEKRRQAIQQKEQKWRELQKRRAEEAKERAAAEKEKRMERQLQVAAKKREQELAAKEKKSAYSKFIKPVTAANHGGQQQSSASSSSSSSAKRLSKSHTVPKAVAAMKQNGPVRAVHAAPAHHPNAQKLVAVPPKPAASAKRPSNEENYPISDKESSSEDDSDDEAMRKPIPDWARGSRLREALHKQCGPNSTIDPDRIFAEIPSCNLNEIFSNAAPKKKQKYARRGSSGNWGTDKLTMREKEQYRRDMGWR